MSRKVVPKRFKNKETGSLSYTLYTTKLFTPTATTIHRYVQHPQSLLRLLGLQAPLDFRKSPRRLTRATHNQTQRNHDPERIEKNVVPPEVRELGARVLASELDELDRAGAVVQHVAV